MMYGREHTFRGEIKTRSDALTLYTVVPPLRHFRFLYYPRHHGHHCAVTPTSRHHAIFSNENVLGASGAPCF